VNQSNMISQPVIDDDKCGWRENFSWRLAEIKTKDDLIYFWNRYRTSLPLPIEFEDKEPYVFPIYKPQTKRCEKKLIALPEHYWQKNNVKSVDYFFPSKSWSNYAEGTREYELNEKLLNVCSDVNLRWIIPTIRPLRVDIFCFFKTVVLVLDLFRTTDQHIIGALICQNFIDNIKYEKIVKDEWIQSKFKMNMRMLSDLFTTVPIIKRLSEDPLIIGSKLHHIKNYSIGVPLIEKTVKEHRDLLTSRASALLPLESYQTKVKMPIFFLIHRIYYPQYQKEYVVYYKRKPNEKSKEPTKQRRLK
jgi:hypothetical protein